MHALKVIHVAMEFAFLALQSHAQLIPIHVSPQIHVIQYWDVPIPIILISVMMVMHALKVIHVAMEFVLALQSHVLIQILVSLPFATLRLDV